MQEDENTGRRYINKDINKVVYVNTKKNEKLQTFEIFKTNIIYVLKRTNCKYLHLDLNQDPVWDKVLSLACLPIPSYRLTYLDIKDINLIIKYLI